MLMDMQKKCKDMSQKHGCAKCSMGDDGISNMHIICGNIPNMLSLRLFFIDYFC